MIYRQVIRERMSQAGIGRSPITRLFGVWEPTGSLLMAHETVLFQRRKIGDEMQTIPVLYADMDTLGEADCFDVAGPLLGNVGQFDNPGKVFGRPVSPLVWIDTRDGLDTAQDPKWSSAAAMPDSEIVAGLSVKVLGVNLTGKVDTDGGVAEREYLDTKEVVAAVLRFEQEISLLEGAPVVVAAKPDRLVGMLFNIRAIDGKAVTYCFPANRIGG